MTPFAHPTAQALREHALALPETSEGTSCVNRAFKVRKKNFLFVGEKPDGTVRVMLKLTAHRDEALAMGGPVNVGGTGWMTLEFVGETPVPMEVLERWTTGSFVACAPKTVARAAGLLP